MRSTVVIQQPRISGSLAAHNDCEIFSETSPFFKCVLGQYFIDFGIFVLRALHYATDMEHAKAVLGAWTKIEDAVSGEQEVKDMMRSRIQSLNSIQEALSAANILSPEVDKLRLIKTEIERLHEKYTASEGESNFTKGLKKVNRGVDHQKIRDELAKIDRDTVRLVGGIHIILTIGGQLGVGFDRSGGLPGGVGPPKYHQQGEENVLSKIFKYVLFCSCSATLRKSRSLTVRI